VMVHVMRRAGGDLVFIDFDYFGWTTR